MRESILVYDRSEPSNAEAFKRLPAFYQCFITDKINFLKAIVYEAFSGNCKYRPIFTSGFRSYSVNKACGGVSDSLHLFGLAVDFVLVGKDWGEDIKPSLYYDICKDIFQPVIRVHNMQHEDNRVQQIIEKTHIHFQYDRR